MSRPCNLCGRSIEYVRMASGSWMPVDDLWREGDGSRHLVEMVHNERNVLEGHMRPHAGPDVRGREPHFGTCEPYTYQQRIKKMDPGQLRAEAERVGVAVDSQHSLEKGTQGHAQVIKFLVNKKSQEVKREQH